MKLVSLYHNPGAGNEGHSREALIELIEECGFSCRNPSSNSMEDDEPGTVDFIVVAGGDGTVRTLTKEFLDENTATKKLPIALLPMGTANNIAKTLNIAGETKEIIQSWHYAIPKKYDVGVITDGDQSLFFLESFGYGIFPYLIQKMKKQGEENLKPEEKIPTALQLLYKIILSYEPKFCDLYVDGKDHSGKFLLVEIMNSRSLGPNLFLSPQGDPGDGIIELVLVPEKDKEKFASYVSKKINGIEEDYQFQILKASKKITISWAGTHIHIDDEIVKSNKSETVNIELRKGLLEFMVSKV